MLNIKTTILATVVSVFFFAGILYFANQTFFVEKMFVKEFVPTAFADDAGQGEDVGLDGGYGCPNTGPSGAEIAFDPSITPDCTTNPELCTSLTCPDGSLRPSREECSGGGDLGSCSTVYLACPATLPPTNLQASCVLDANGKRDGRATFTWSPPVSGADSYHIRNDNAHSPAWEPTDACIPGVHTGGDQCINFYGPTSYTTPLTNPGTANPGWYSFWLHTVQGGNVSASTGTTVSCFVEPPTNPVGSCNADGTVGTFSWTAPVGHDTFYTRVDTGVEGDHSLWDNNFVGTTKTFTATPGKSYPWWVHTKSPTTGAYSARIGGTISCPAISVAFQGAGCILPAGGGSCNITSSWTVNGLPAGETVTLNATGPGLAYNYQKLPTTFAEAKTAVRSALDAVYSALLSHARSALAAVYGGLPLSSSSSIPVSQSGTFNLNLLRTTGGAQIGTAIALVSCPFGYTINKASDGSETCVAPTSTTTSTPLTFMSCTVSPKTASVGDSVTWTANVSGGTSPHSYSWTGTEGLLGTTKTVEKTYNTTGTKSASVTVTDSLGASTGAASCSTTAGEVTVTVGVPTLLVTPNRVRLGELTRVSGDLKGNTGCSLSSNQTFRSISTVAPDIYLYNMENIRGETTFTLQCKDQPAVTGKVRVIAQPVEI